MAGRRYQVGARVPECRRVKPKPSQRRKFPTRYYTMAGIALQTKVDAAHQGLSSAAVRRLLQRGLEVFQDEAYQTAGISVSHIYNLRGTGSYRKHRAVYKPTQSTPVVIGARRKARRDGCE